MDEPYVVAPGCKLIAPPCTEVNSLTAIVNKKAAFRFYRRVINGSIFSQSKNQKKFRSSCARRSPRKPQAASAAGFYLAAQLALDVTEAAGSDSNLVACKTPSPKGVGIAIRYGTISRLPAKGASHISVSCCAARKVIRKWLGL